MYRQTQSERERETGDSICLNMVKHIRDCSLIAPSRLRLSGIALVIHAQTLAQVLLKCRDNARLKHRDLEIVLVF